MLYNKIPLTFEKQLNLLRERGLIIENEEKALKLLKNISYYKLKEFLKPYEKIRESSNENIENTKVKEIYYKEISFELIVERFYMDKNIRIYLLHAIEKIELSIKNQFAYILGQRDGYRYLKFNNWCNKEEYCKHYLEFKEKEFKETLKNSLNRNTNENIKEFNRLNEEKKFPPIWIIIDILTLGEVIHLFAIMSNKNKETISKNYGLSKEEFESWIKHIRFIRNKCAHNGNVIDLKIKTKPKVKSEWHEILYSYDKEGKKIITDRIANTLLIVSYLVKKINCNYDFKNLYESLNKLIKNDNLIANKLGFNSPEDIEFLLKNIQ